MIRRNFLVLSGQAVAAILVGIGLGMRDDKITVTLHLPQRLIDELRIAAASRHNLSLEEYITETLANAVSDCLVLPGGCRNVP